ncbi:unnamed protein product [Peniophora sp. CBMAI 1063]|nr:unnamed protein product [Peniophora sp. CBMAI 1063]
MITAAPAPRRITNSATQSYSQQLAAYTMRQRAEAQSALELSPEEDARLLASRLARAHSPTDKLRAARARARGESPRRGYGF